MQKFSIFIISLILIFVPLYPKFPLLGVSGTFVSVRLEDFLLVFAVSFWLIRRRFSILPIHKSIILYLLVGFFAFFSGVFLTKTSALNLGFLHLLRRVEYMVGFFIAYDLFKSKVELNFLVKVILTTSFLVAIYGLGQQFLGFPVISTNNSEFSKGLALTLGPGARINSTFAGHYDLAAFSVLPLLLVLSLLSITQQSKSNKWILLAIGTLVYWSLLLSASRITFASFFICAGLLVLSIRKKIWLIPLIILAIVSILVTPQLRGRYFELITNIHAQEVSKDVNSVPDALKPPAVPEDRSFSIRINAEWPRALRSFYKNPIFGTGFSSTGLATDNDFLRSLAETGLFGLAAFLLIFIRFFKTSLKFIVRYDYTLESAFIVSVSIYLGSLLLNALFIDVFEASKIAIITWTILGVTEKIKNLS